MFDKIGGLLFDFAFAASDGKLTLEEIAEVLAKHYPDNFTDLVEEVKKANEDGHYSFIEVVHIITAAVS